MDAMSDFDMMLMKRKEEKGVRRRRKDIDIINDNDDIIAQLISDMKHAASVRDSPFFLPHLAVQILPDCDFLSIGGSQIEPRRQTRLQESRHAVQSDVSIT